MASSTGSVRITQKANLTIVRTWSLLSKYFGRCTRGFGVLNDRVGFNFQ
jgi:hypothetical protein